MQDGDGMSDPSMVSCHSCKEQFSFTADQARKYCPSCGTRLDKPRAKPPKPGERYLYEPERIFEDPDGISRKECRECGTVIEAEREYCPGCGSRFMLSNSGTFVQAAVEAHYLGGSSALGAPRVGRLTFAQDGVYFDSCSVAVAEVKCVEIGGGQVAKSKIAATVMFGVWGGLAAKGSKDRTEIAVHLLSGQAAFFIIENRSPFVVRARITPALRAAGIPFAEEQADATSSPVASEREPNIVEQLERLADLHDRGFLTDEEVAAAKAKLLE